MTGAKAVVIGRRMSTLGRASRLLVPDEGRLAGLETHDELLESCPTYRSLWGTQAAVGFKEFVR